MKIVTAFLVLGASLAVCRGQFFPVNKLRNPITNAASGTLSNAASQVSGVAKLFTEQFGSFKDKFNKVYSNEAEEKKRLEIFSNNQQNILDLQKLSNLPYTLKINQYADLISEEFNRLVNGLKINRQNSHASKYQHNATSEEVSNNVDWRREGAVTPSRSQGQCGSCYAFVAAGALEGHLFRKTGKLESLSPQNILDCTKNAPYSNNGCTSGAVDPSFDFVKDNNGINSESTYPYKEAAKEQCDYVSSDSVTSVQNYVLLDEGDEKGLEEVLSKKGPVAASIDAHAKSFQFYGGGIYYEPTCSSSIDRLNHAVLLIGFGTETNGQKYWLIKNSYGPEWGENGFAKIARNVTNHCGVATYALYPEV